MHELQAGVIFAGYPHLAGARVGREAELAGRLDHPNIVAIHDRGSEDGRLWIAMQYVAGTDVEPALRGGPLPPQRGLHIARSTADALDHAHAGDGQGSRAPVRELR
ncbi:hypothetical protein ACWF82_10465 [Nocardia sp. NPDC055053]